MNSSSKQTMFNLSSTPGAKTSPYKMYYSVFSLQSLRRFSSTTMLPRISCSYTSLTFRISLCSSNFFCRHRFCSSNISTSEWVISNYSIILSRYADPYLRFNSVICVSVSWVEIIFLFVVILSFPQYSSAVAVVAAPSILFVLGVLRGRGLSLH